MRLRAVGPGLAPRLSSSVLDSSFSAEPEGRHLTCPGVLCKASAEDFKKAQNSLEMSPGAGHHMCLPSRAALAAAARLLSLLSGGETRGRAGGGDEALPRLDTKCILQEG